jgi:hypothetical protein
MSSYNKQPHIDVKGYEKHHSWQGYDEIVEEILKFCTTSQNCMVSAW